MKNAWFYFWRRFLIAQRSLCSKIISPRTMRVKNPRKNPRTTTPTPTFTFSIKASVSIKKVLLVSFGNARRRELLGLLTLYHRKCRCQLSTAIFLEEMRRLMICFFWNFYKITKVGEGKRESPLTKEVKFCIIKDRRLHQVG